MSTEREQLLERVKVLQQRLAEKFSATNPNAVESVGIRNGGLNRPASNAQSFGRGLLSSAVDNLLTIPDIAARIPATAVNELARIPQNLGSFAGAIRTGQMWIPNTTPPLINIPPIGQNFVVPNSNQVFGAAQRLGEGAAALSTGNFSQFTPGSATQNQAAISENLRQANPNASLMGDLTGDVATLFALRQPSAKQRAMQELAVRNEVRAMRLAENAGEIANSPTIKTAVEAAFKNSTGMKLLFNRAGRAVETGIEGAVIGLFNDNDPLQVAAYAAGGQVAGSLFLGGLTGIFSGGLGRIGLKLGASAFAIGSVVQMVKTVTPGGRDFVTASLESGFDKVALAIAIGAISGMAGLGRVTSRFPVAAMPRFADAISSLPRAGVIAAVNEALTDKSTEKVLRKLALDPLYFGRHAATELERAITSKRGSVSETINELMQNDEFRKRLEGL